ncbi:radical SAM family heme chaperone HemW [Desertibacillus haloalkaliphilus]|uniref:radical SAM family heme chaperone HemW n=1 Tax=Desertibacillus haloalkaliphilus TaxID=1328930 RepID=UPI001C2698E5|nr:radical SAM family heme chaperone HemW [Desertibacillus haloalkaliphilus]MBU8905629.1 radical SAM family heme chaperone HemW [Desertibacillus haloalkaliphilus]
MPKSVYVHIPFCEQICHYCDFNKVFLKGQPVADYLQALDQECRNTVAKVPPTRIETIYVGGGTPTALNAEQLDTLFKSLNDHFVPRADRIEFTVEVNPGSIDRKKLEVMKAAGVNRLSIGVQTFDNDLLAGIGRTHKSKDIYHTIELARSSGFENLSIDLIFGLPKQTVESFQRTLEETILLGVEHVSAYSLKVEEKTVFYNLQRKGKLVLPPEEAEVNMYERLLAAMSGNGYHQYEISNFAKEGYESTHNLTYWNNEEYYGIGAGAHGYLGAVRTVNAGPLNKYMSLIQKQGNPYIESHVVSKNERMEEEMFMGLRKKKGVSKQRFYQRFGVKVEDVFADPLQQLTKQGLLKVDGDQISLTDTGIFLGNEVFEKFLLI